MLTFAEHHRYAAIIVENVVLATPIRSCHSTRCTRGREPRRPTVEGTAGCTSSHGRTGNRMPHLQPTPPARCPVHGPIKARTPS